MRPTFEQVKEVLACDRETGILTWICPSRGRIIKGAPAGNLQSDGYILVGLFKRYYYAHCLAWLLTTGEWPTVQVDHKNNVRNDNRWSELRAATHAQNNYNTKKTRRNTSGFKGVYWCKRYKKWRASITVDKKTIWLGIHDTPKEAHDAYLLAAEKYFKEFARAE